jgi:hypothetical protein
MASMESTSPTGAPGGQKLCHQGPGVLAAAVAKSNSLHLT